MLLVAFLMAALTLLAAPKKGDQTVYFKSSMHCAACENKLFEQLRFEKGVKELETDHVSNTVRVVYAPSKTAPGKLAAAIEKAGYKAVAIDSAAYRGLVDSAAERSPRL